MMSSRMFIYLEDYGTRIKRSQKIELDCDLLTDLPREAREQRVSDSIMLNGTAYVAPP
jgi:hypothetical protein